MWNIASGSVGSGYRITDAGSLTNAATLGSGVTLGSGARLTNTSAGVISGSGTLVVASAGAATVVNAGNITGTAAASAGVYLKAGGLVSNQSGGTISGVAYAVRFKAGFTNRVAIGSGAVFSGKVDGGNTIGAASISTLELVSGASTGTLSSLGSNYVHFADVTVDSGAVWNIASGSVGSGYRITAATVVNTGNISGASTGGIGVYLKAGGTITNQSGGTIGGVADAVLFKAGFTDRLVVGAGAVFSGTVDGGNTIGATSVSTLELASAAGAGTLNSLGSQFTHFAAVTVDSGADWTLSGTNSLVAGATLTNSGTLTDTGTMSNAGTITGNALRLNGGTLTNQIGGLITASYVYGVAAGGSDSVVNQGTISDSSGSAIYLEAAGNVSNAAGALLSGYGMAVKLRGTGATLSNLGQISSTSPVPSSYGVYLRNGGLVTNGQAGSGTSTASIQGYYGVAFKSVDVVNAYGTLDNYGTIRSAGTVSSGVLLSNAGTVFNGQSGATGALIEGGRYGVSDGQGVVVNDATIIATGTIGGDNGVAIQGVGTVSNLGTAALIEGYVGVLIGTDGTLTNAGTIESNQGTSGTAVWFTGGNARLIDDPGALFIGAIYGGSGGTAVLELASGSSAGTITGLGSSVTNFTSLVFDSGADWTVSGNDAANGLGALGISGFSVGDTIDLNGFVAANRTFASNTLTLGDGVGHYDTLHVLGGFSTTNFQIVGDGSGGTDITFVNPPTITAGGTVTFVGGGSAITLDSGLTATDPESTTLVSGTVSFGTGFLSGDTLNFINQNGITGSYNNSTGTLTLNGTATLLQYQTTLDSITYSFNPSSGDPTGGGGDTSRTINWAVDDGIVTSAVGTSTLDVSHVAPTLTTSGTVTFNGGDVPVMLDPTLSVSDPDSGNQLTSATINIVGFVSGDALVADTTGTAIKESFNTSTGVLTLSGLDTLIDYQVVLRSVEYSFNPANGDPTGGGGNNSRTIEWSVNDGAAVSNTGTTTLDLVHVAPTIATGGTVTFTGGGSPVTLDASVSLTDPDSGGNLTGATISVGAGFLSGDALNFANQNSITGNFNSATGVLTLTGSDTLADYQSALDSITYSFSPSNGDPTGGGGDTSRTIDWVVSDDSSSNGVSNSGSSTVSVQQAPCYRRGTRILTDRGEVAVEDLVVGDLVQTLTLGTAEPIVWIGYRHVDCARHNLPEQVWPVRVAADAFGSGMPHADLFLSPDHAVFAEGVLIPVRYLINDSTITQVTVDQVSYYHIELATHEVILAQGLPAETYLDTGDRAKFANAGGPVSLFGNFSAGIWEASGCAPLIVTGAKLASVRRDVNTRAAAMDRQTAAIRMVA